MTTGHHRSPTTGHLTHIFQLLNELLIAIHNNNNNNIHFHLEELLESKGGLMKEFLLRAALRFDVGLSGGRAGGGGGVVKGAIVFDEQLGEV